MDAAISWLNIQQKSMAPQCAAKFVEITESSTIQPKIFAGQKFSPGKNFWQYIWYFDCTTVD